MAALQYTAGHIAHDLNNYLTAILGYSELMEGNLASVSPARTYLTEVRKAAAKAAVYTRQLQAFGGRQVLDRDAHSLSDVVERAAPAVRQALGPDRCLDLVLEPVLPAVALDEGSIEHVLAALAEEASHTVAVGGTLRLETGVVESDDGPPAWVRLLAVEEGQVRDEEAGDWLLEPFRGSDPRSLALAAAFGIVGQHGGTMSVLRLRSGDRAFEVLLPVSTP